MTLLKKKKFFVQQNPNEILHFLLFGQMDKERKKMASKNTKKDLQKNFFFYFFSAY